ncbi:MAG: hypothetical protein M3O02_08530 [Acidobacteriota bacterium]|nr:hypothetical protein [Acidobacteriota bacterium]
MSGMQPAAPSTVPPAARSATRSTWQTPVGTALRRGCLLLAGLLVALGSLTPSAHGQRRRPRRETNANRKARIARTIEETYTHRWELGGGGGFLRFRSGQTLQKNSEITFWFDGTYYLNQKLGLTGEIRGAYGNAKIGNTPYNIPNPQISEYPYLFGPTYRFVLRERYAVSGFALGGAAIGKFDADTKAIPAPSLGLWPSTAAHAAFSVGANLDLNVYPNIAFRIAPNYTGTTFGGSLQNNLGFGMGIVYRFGHQK